MLHVVETVRPFVQPETARREADAARRPAANFTEYAVKVVYVLQITPTTFLKPDLQVV